MAHNLSISRVLHQIWKLLSLVEEAEAQTQAKSSEEATEHQSRVMLCAERCSNQLSHFSVRQLFSKHTLASFHVLAIRAEEDEENGRRQVHISSAGRQWYAEQ